MIHSVDVDAVVSALMDCGSVMGLGNEIGTYLGGRRIAGIQVLGDMVRVHVLGRYGKSIDELCTEVSAAVAPLMPGKCIDIAVVDVVEPYPFGGSD